MTILLDLVMLAIIIVCARSGYKKGAIMGLGGIVVIVVSLYAADLLSNTYSYEAIPAMRPFMAGYMEKEFREAVYDNLGIMIENDDNNTEGTVAGEGLRSVNDLIKDNPDIVHNALKDSFLSLGVFSKVAATLASETEEYARENSVGVQSAMVEVMCLKTAYVAGFILSFLIILIILTVIGNLSNLSFKLPEMENINMELVNDATGTALGVITGILFCVILVWVLKFIGIFLSEETVMRSGFTAWLVRRDILFRYLGI